MKMLPGKITLNVYTILKDRCRYAQKDLLSFLNKEKDIHEYFAEGNIDTKLDEEIYSWIRLLASNKDIKEKEIIDTGKIICDELSIDPLDEILSIVDKCKYQACNSDAYFIISVSINIENISIHLAYISLLIDDRITLFGKKAAFFIGIRKSFSFAVSQKLGASKEYPKVSGLLIEAVEAISRSFDAEAIFTFPLANMYKILCSYYNFSTLSDIDEEERDKIINTEIKIGYWAPCQTLVDLDGAEDVVYRLFE